MRLESIHAVVLGLARQGEAAARLLLRSGASVTVVDSADGESQRVRSARLPGATVALGRTDPGDVEGADLVVASAGVPPSSPWVKASETAGVPVWSDVELAYHAGIRPVAAVTGTKGKTTTTEMIVAALQAGGTVARAAANIGHAICEAEPSETIVAELSSFQLDRIDAFRAPVAVLLNVAPDHLDWHGSFEAYARAKARIFENQRPDDAAIFDADAVSYAGGAAASRVPFALAGRPGSGAGVEGGWIVTPQGRVIDVDRLKARGRPNLVDAIAAASAACALGMDPAAVGEGLASYVPGPHRLETIATIDGVVYVNDSKATDPHATLAALEELDRVVLIAGGRNKGLDLSELAVASPRLRAVVAIGEAAQEIEDAFASAGVVVGRAASMEEAVARARALAGVGDTILLSPACASLDMFTDFEARGEAFRAAVLARGGRP